MLFFFYFCSHLNSFHLLNYYKTFFACLAVVSDCYKWLICWLCRETDRQIDELTARGACKFTARNEVQVCRARLLPRVYFQHMALNFFWQSSHKLTNDKSMTRVFERLGLLYGLWTLERERYLVLLYEGGYATGPALVQLINQSVMKLCSALKPDIMGVIDALAPPDFVLNSVIGKSDGLVCITFIVIINTE